MKNLYLVFSILFIFMSASCEKSAEKEPPKSGAKELLSITFFKINNSILEEDIMASKSGSTFKANFSQGKNLRNLSAVLNISKGAKLIYEQTEYHTQDGEVTVHGDFTAKVEFSVVAEDGTQAKYSLTSVSEPFSSEKSILSFVVRSQENHSIGKDLVGTISGNTIRLTVPSGTESSLKAEIKISQDAKIFDGENKAVESSIPYPFSSVYQADGNEVRSKIKIEAQDKSFQEYQVIVNTEKGKPTDTFEHSGPTKLSSIFFKTGMEAEIAYFTSPIYITFQYDAQGRIKKIRYYLYLDKDGKNYYSYVGADIYTYKTSSVDIRKLSIFYDLQDYGNLTSELGTNGYPKNLRYLSSTDGNTFYSNFHYNSAGNLIRQEGKGSMFDAGSVFEDLTGIPFDVKYEYKNGNLVKSGTSIYSYFTDRESNDGWAQGLVALGTDARKGIYYVHMGKTSKNLLKQIYDSDDDTSIDFSYKFDGNNRVNEMRVTTTLNDHWGTDEKPAIVEFNYSK